MSAGSVWTVPSEPGVGPVVLVLMIRPVLTNLINVDPRLLRHVLSEGIVSQVADDALPLDCWVGE